MNHAIILPAISPGNTGACLGTMSTGTLERVILIDNTATGEIAEAYGDQVATAIPNMRNAGVARSWNNGLRIAFGRGAYNATLCSTSMRFDEDGGAALLQVADFCRDNTQWPWGFESLNGWHLITIGAKLFEQLGEFDETFWPAYFEDNDYIWRMRVAGILEPAGAPRYDRKLPWVPTLKYACVGDGLAVSGAGVKVDLDQLRAYYVDKWGGPPGEEQWATPHGNIVTPPAAFGHDFSCPVIPHG